MATHPICTSVIRAETEIPLHRTIYNWDINNFDRICSPRTRQLEPISSTYFRTGSEVGRDSEWELALAADSGHLNVSLYLRRIFVKKIKQISVNITIKLVNSAGKGLLKGRCVRSQTFTLRDNGLELKYIQSIKTLWEDREAFLADNTLRLRTRVDIIGDPFTLCKESSGAKPKLPEEDASMDLLKEDFRRLLLSHSGTDLIFECEGEQFPVHKAIVTARSKKLVSILENDDTTESRTGIVKVENQTVPAVLGMLDYIYTGDIRLAHDIHFIIKLIEAADMYEIEDLKNQCFKKLSGKLKHENVGEIAIAAYMHNAQVEVLEEIRAYTQRNWHALMKMPSFKEAIIESPRAFFEDVNVNMEVDDSQAAGATASDSGSSEEK